MRVPGAASGQDTYPVRVCECARASARAHASHGSYHNAGGLDLPWNSGVLDCRLTSYQGKSG